MKFKVSLIKHGHVIVDAADFDEAAAMAMEMEEIEWDEDESEVDDVVILEEEDEQ